MARKTEEKTIRGRTFKVTQLPAMRGTNLFVRLSGVIVPALTKLGKGLEVLDGRDLANTNILALLAETHDAAVFLFEKLTPAEFERLLRELLESSTVKPLDGGPEQALMPIFDDEMAGEIGAVLELVAFALKVNFGNFMPGLVAKATQAAAKAGFGSKESTISPGLAGAS